MRWLLCGSGIARRLPQRAADEYFAYAAEPLPAASYRR